MAFIKINKQHFYHNLNQIALQTGSVDKIAIVLKDNAYGHGLKTIGKLASEFGVKHAVVRTTKEAREIASFFSTVLVLGDEIIQDEKLSFTINSIEAIDKAEVGARVELKVDTGMHRNGISIDELDDALKGIEQKELKLVGVMTHFRSADELSSELFWQQKRFASVCKKVKKAGFTEVRVHSHNSAAILRTKHFNEDLVRVGIGAYGYNELPSSFDTITLKPVMELWVKRVSTRLLQKGERIGYGGTFTASHAMEVSTYDLGYGDGWFRADTMQPFKTAEGLEILGRVSMDFISLESTKDEVCIVSNAQDAAKQLGTISYEVTTALNPHIQRDVV
ncbi:MAG: Alanine racemase (EC [uncultured Sulfurovum sp.]|uniref:Alanine racemase (EC) n=1 Tax=uncultured Sulfurovum sp. TaxID=269237 RepID=A0A6S6TMQ0_9BACT|nr:MAG: Alanine racemase (EC [uncultured Sulfurovum sp.]